MSPFQPVQYKTLNARQKENHNFHKVAARLADYGFTSVRLSDDFEGADFIALHCDGSTILRVQLKSRATIDRKYLGKDLFIAFRSEDRVFVYPHDELVALLEGTTLIASTESWREKGQYTWPYLSTKLANVLEEFEL